MLELAECLPKTTDWLSAEELRLWNHITSLGGGDQLESNETDDLSHAKTVKDRDLSAGILALEASTVTFQEQTNLLKTQQQHQETWIQRDGLSESISRNTADEALNKKQLELQRLHFAIEETHQSLIERVQSCNRVSIQRRSEIARLINDGLEEHDGRLFQLQSAMRRLTSPTNAEDQLSIRTRSLLDKLVALLAEEIHERLDRVFLTMLHEISESEGHSGPEAEISVESLETDLESLRAEILDVAAMFVRDQFEQPIFQVMRREQICRAKEITAIATEAITALELLLDWLENFTHYCQTFSSFDATLGTIGHHISQYASTNRRGHESKSIQIDAIHRPTASLEALLGALGVSQQDMKNSVTMSSLLVSNLSHTNHGLSNTVAPFCTIVYDHLGTIDRASQTMIDASWADGQHEARKKLDSTHEQIANLGRRLAAADISRATNISPARREFLTQWT